MRATIRAFALILFCQICGVSMAVAQCAQSMYSGTYACSSQTCSGSGLVQTPIGSGPNGGYFTCLTYSCCGENFPYCYFTGTSCNNTGKLNDPVILKSLYELARTQDVMVVSCDGNYHPLAAIVTEHRDLDMEVRKLPGIGGGGR